MTSTVVGSVAAITVALLVLGAAVVAVFVYLRRELHVETDPKEALELRVATLELQIQEFPSLWEEERKRAKRSQQAANAARKDAEEKLEEVAELLEAGEQLPIEYGEGVEEAGVQPMRTRLGDPPAADRVERVAAIAHLMR